jgi:aminoglycoside 3-N-acetyltransferase
VNLFIPAVPLTRGTLAADLAASGLNAGDTVLVHSSLRAIGWVCGGAVAVVQALLDILGPEGTLVVPAMTAGNRDPSTWQPPVPPSWWPIIRDSLPGFDPALTPSEAVGAVAEQVRTWPGAVRSDHPQSSFAAVGSRAAALMAGHRLDCHLGEESPLARLAAAGARVLLLGVGYHRATVFHLAEYRQADPPRRDYSCAVLTGRQRRWITYRDVDLDDSDFGRLGRDFERETGLVLVGRVGAATTPRFGVPDAVDFARSWLATHRATHRAPAVRSGDPC